MLGERSHWALLFDLEAKVTGEEQTQQLKNPTKQKVFFVWLGTSAEGTPETDHLK